MPLGCEWTQLWLVEHVAGAGHRQQVTTPHTDLLLSTHHSPLTTRYSLRPYLLWQVVTLHRDAVVTLPPDMPASGRGLIGLVLTTGATTAIQP